MVGVGFRLAMALMLICTAGCSRELTEAEARQKADEFARSKFSMGDLAKQNIETVEKTDSFEVSYSPKGEAAFGGPLIVAVDKRTGEPRLVAAYQ